MTREDYSSVGSSKAKMRFLLSTEETSVSEEKARNKERRSTAELHFFCFLFSLRKRFFPEYRKKVFGKVWFFSLLEGCENMLTPARQC